MRYSLLIIFAGYFQEWRFIGSMLLLLKNWISVLFNLNNIFSLSLDLSAPYFYEQMDIRFLNSYLSLRFCFGGFFLFSSISATAAARIVVDAAAAAAIDDGGGTVALKPTS
jgi:hypothetical protein